MFQAVGIKTGLFNRGLTRACLKLCDTIPDDRDLFMILVTMGMISSINHKGQRWVWGQNHKTFGAFPGLQFLQTFQLQVETLQRLC